MLARNHAITAVTSFGIVSGGVALADRTWGNPVGDLFAWIAQQASDYMLFGHEPFSVVIILCAMLYMLGAFLPDIDNPKSVLGRLIHIKLVHRTWLHSLWPVLLLALAGWWVRPVSWIALGWFVHLFWDSLSRQGICWFYPFPGFIEYDSGARIKRGHWIWFYRTGKITEYVLSLLSIVAFAVIFYIVVRQGLIPMSVT